MTILVSFPSRPPAPVSFSPSARARSVSSSSSCSSAADSSTSSRPRSVVTSVIWCLLRLGSYTVEITVPSLEPVHDIREERLAERGPVDQADLEVGDGVARHRCREEPDLGHVALRV